jgi:hypothetical protein
MGNLFFFEPGQWTFIATNYRKTLRYIPCDNMPAIVSDVFVISKAILTITVSTGDFNPGHRSEYLFTVFVSNEPAKS